MLLHILFALTAIFQAPQSSAFPISPTLVIPTAGFMKDCNAPVNPALIPLPSCVSYQGFPGGLFVGTNTQPAALTAKAAVSFAEVLPRDVFGNIDLINGHKIVLTLGQSYSFAVGNFAADYYKADPNADPQIDFLNAAQGAGGPEMSDVNSPYWQYVFEVINASPYTYAQVEIIWLMTTKLFPTAAFPQHAIELEQNILAIQDNVNFLFPNVRICYISPRMTSRYADVSGPPPYLLAPPYDYEVGFADQWAIRDQTNSTITLLWANYWYDQNVPCSYFGADGTHLSPSGALWWGKKLARFFLANL